VSGVPFEPRLEGVAEPRLTKPVPGH
jgi:hypothetical protein